MKPLTLSEFFKRHGLLLYFKVYATLFLIFFVSFSVLAYPEHSSEGIKAGISLCFDKLIPSLFPFMIISSFLLKSEAYKALTAPFGNLTERLFRLPKATLPVIFMSLIGGYPIGAIMTSTIYDKKKISYEDAKHLMTFCVNPSISFCLSFIGAGLYGNIKAGLIVYLSTIISSLIIGTTYGRLKKDAIYQKDKEQNRGGNVSLSVAFTESVSESTAAITGICVTVIIFSCILNLTEIFIINKYIHSSISFLLEITNFAQKNYRFVSLYIMSAAASFGGICTHFQIMPYLLRMKIRYKDFLLYRIIDALLSYLISTLLFSLFPAAVPTSAHSFDKAVVSNAGIPVSCTLIAMAVIIIFTDNAIAKIKGSKKI